MGAALEEITSNTCSARGPQGEALGCSQGGWIQGSGTPSLSKDPACKLGPGLAEHPPICKITLALTVGS